MFWDEYIKSGVGAVQKAFLIIHEEDASAVRTMKDVSLNTINALSAAAAGSSLSEVSAGLSGAGLPVKNHVMRVQYNPSSLMFQANAQPIPFTYLMQNIDEGVPNQNNRPPMVVLSVELIFDAMTPSDAFLMDKTRLAETAAAGVVSAVKGGYTVQPQTDGLIAAILRPQTRLVTFRWADMAFTGHLIEAQADYSMFSGSGRPIRSKVRVNIAQQVESGADIQYWNDAVDKMFESGGFQDLKNTAQAVGNLLNLDMF